MKIWNKIRAFLFDLKATWRSSYIPPLMIYFAAGLSAFTGIVESFFVKGSLTLSAESLAALAFWVGIPWAFKVPFGHMVDRYWRHRAKFVYLGAGLMTASLGIMALLTSVAGRAWLGATPDLWYCISCIIAPFGYILQDAVADPMTVEAVPPVDDPVLANKMHTTMQTLGRVAVVGGSAMVAGAAGWLTSVFTYSEMYTLALFIPLISVSGVVLAKFFKKTPRTEEMEKCDPWIWIASVGFLALAVFLGLSGWSTSQELIFVGSMGICAVLMHRVFQSLAPEKRLEILVIALMIFAFRAMPGSGPGIIWWEIDVLGFDEGFFGTLAQTGAIVAIFGMFMLRSWMARRPIPYLILFLTGYSVLTFLPYIGMYYGLHEWTQAHLGFGQRTLAFVDTAVAATLSQVAMIPMLAWIAREAPLAQKATYFAVMAGFSNLALSASQLGTKYLNQVFVITRGEYSQLGWIMIAALALEVSIPVAVVLIGNRVLKRRKLK